MLVVLHVDEVDDDDAAEVAQAQLPRHRLRRFEIGAIHRLFEIALAEEGTGVSVDADAVEALLGLGYSRRQAEEAIAGVKGETTEARIRGALQLLGKKS